jgi:phosphatidylserine/phosphatidylglycerophosphate/cardiolipin synthase-like enzyme
MVYEIGLHDARDAFIRLHKAGVTLRVLVSGTTLGSSSAAENYEAMSEAGIDVRTAAACYSFAHQKFWVSDNHTAFVATGNLDHSDFPDGSDTYPVGSYAYRDFTVRVEGAAVGIFTILFDAEWANGAKWRPSGL